MLLTGNKARSIVQPRFIVFLSALFIIVPPLLQAACPPGTGFKTRNSYKEKVSVSQLDRTLNEGGFSLSMDLSLPIGDAGLTLSSGGFTPIVIISLGIPPGQWQWELRVPLSTTVEAGDLIVSYQVSGSDGTPGVFTSEQDPTSKVQVTVTTRRISQQDKKKERRFQGYIDLEIDYSNATRAGKYSGTIDVTVDCP